MEIFEVTSRLGRCLVATGIAVTSAAALGQSAMPEQAPADIEIVVTAPVQGSEIERGKVPTNT